MNGILTSDIVLRCIYCGCTEDDACLLENGEPCSWAQSNPPVCTAPDCIAQSFVNGTAEPIVALTAMRSALFALRQEGLL